MTLPVSPRADSDAKGRVDLLAPKHLDEAGRCCGRKPMIYKRPKQRLFCPRCDAEFDPHNGKQTANWAYGWVGDRMARKNPLTGKVQHD